MKISKTKYHFTQYKYEPEKKEGRTYVHCEVSAVFSSDNTVLILMFKRVAKLLDVQCFTL